MIQWRIYVPVKPYLNETLSTIKPNRQKMNFQLKDVKDEMHTFFHVYFQLMMLNDNWASYNHLRNI